MSRSLLWTALLAKQEVLGGGGYSVVADVLNCDIIVSSKSSRNITFIFRLKPLDKGMNSIIPQLWVLSMHPCCEQYLTSPGGNTLQGTNYTATCLPSQKLSKLDEPDMQDTAGEAGMSSKVMYSYGLPHMAGQKQDDQHKHTFSSYVRIWDVALKTCQRRWMIGRSGERGSWISVLAARHDDDGFYSTTTVLWL